MATSYQPSQWANDDPTTPLSAPRLANMETQYADAIADVIAGATDSSSDVYGAFAQSFATADQVATINGSAFYLYGVRPVLRYTGNAWPARTGNIPSGYTGQVEYDSADWAGVLAPSDAQEGDRWMRQAT